MDDNGNPSKSELRTDEAGKPSGGITEGKINHGGLKPPSTSPRPTVAPQGKVASPKK